MRRLVGFASGLVIVAALMWSGCQKGTTESPMTSENSAQQVTTLGKQDARVQAVMAVQNRHTDHLMKTAGVVGTATGLSDDGSVVMKVYTIHAGVQNIPASLEGVPVEVEVTGEFRAFQTPEKGNGHGGGGGGGGHGGGGGGGVSHTALQTTPIKLGTSGGWEHDLANGYCCGGTLGSLVQKGGKQYILSNYHVLNADIVAGGNGLVATDGDPVIQPGLIDVSCDSSVAQKVAFLSDADNPSLPGSNVDAAIAEVVPGMVSTDGAILEIGTISSQIVAASLNQAVKKSGRTTGLSRSSISGLNATVSVAYDNECAGGAAFTKTYTGQIIIKNRGSKFLNAGDSGSLMVEDVTTNPRAVGLLFAGSSTSAVANPIGDVLAYFGATMVGN